MHIEANRVAAPVNTTHFLTHKIIVLHADVKVRKITCQEKKKKKSSSRFRAENLDDFDSP